MTFAIMALLLGGLTVNANAQVKSVKSVDKDTQTVNVGKDGKEAVTVDAVGKEAKAETKTVKETKTSTTVGKDAKPAAPKTARTEAKATTAKTTGKDAKNSAPKTARTEAKATTAKTTGKEAGKTEDLNKVLKDYEIAVDNCVSIYNEMQKIDKGGKDFTKEFESSLTKAEKLKSQLEKSKPQMDRTQTDRFNKANDKLAKVMIK